MGKNNSWFSLLNRDSSTSLVIIPEKYGNIAHYLSGINNYKKDSKKKQVDSNWWLDDK